MSSPVIHTVTFILWGVLVAFGAPVVAWHHYGPAASIVAIFIIIHVGFGLAMVLSEGEDDPIDDYGTALGPSFLAGSSILFVGMTVIPMAVTPAAVWMWILPVDIHGNFGLSHTFGLELREFRGPHHRGDAA